MKICFILATRPEIIKAYPLIKIFEKNILDNYIICKHDKFNDHLLISALKNLRGLTYFLNGCEFNQKELDNFIKLCKFHLNNLDNRSRAQS